MRYANDELVPVWPEQKTQSILTAFYTEAEKPYVEVALNGVEGFRFLVDTGASMSYVIDTDKARALNLSKGYFLSMGGWGDEEDTTLCQTKVDSLSLAGVRFKDVNLAYLQASKTRYFARPDQAIFDGVLGHDILRHFSWTFDSAANQITISSQPYQFRGDENSIPFEVFFSKISIPVNADFGDEQTVQQDFLIDTGSRHYAKVSAAYVKNNLKLTRPTVQAADFGLSGKTEHQRTTISGLKFGQHLYPNVKVNLIGPDDDEDENWIIGSALLNHQTYIIDYHSNMLYLLPSDRQGVQSKYNLLGLELRKLLDGRFVVRYVMPHMATAEMDFAVDDVIYQINDQPASDYTLVDWLALSAKPGEYKICRERTTKACFTVHSSHITGYSTL